MCGIAGILNPHDSEEQLRDRLLAVRGRLSHRGPDDQGIEIITNVVRVCNPQFSSAADDKSAPHSTPQLCSPSAGFVHTRLAILDLSDAGHQPMFDDTGRYLIVFNGEIYNFRELRAELEGAGETFRSDSDTEVILKMFRRHGLTFVRELKGMFAFAIWDNQERSCFLARDPLGIKPLYFYERNGTLAFASELRALLAFGDVPRELDPAALQGYFLFGSVQEPQTLLKGVRCLPAGHSLVWHDGRSRARKFWDVHFDADARRHEEAREVVREALLDSVRRHFVSDVPVSVFLSGGIDSTAVVALARVLGKEQLRTFSISFDDPHFDEGALARRTAEHFGTEHFDRRMDAPAGRQLMKEFLESCDQPSIDGFNTFCVARHARDHGAKVVLSGLGGDELFGGYPSFRRVPLIVAAARWLSLLGPISRGLAYLAETAVTPAYRRLTTYLRGEPSIAGAYWCVRGVFRLREAAALTVKYTGETVPPETILHFGIPAQPTLEDDVSYLEINRYMRNQLLRDSDVMSMAMGLELRVPFVDDALVESISRIPSAIRLLPNKRLLAEAVPEIPSWVLNHPKRGFTFPFDQWMADEWREEFGRIESESPVRLRTWYRKWSLFALENFLQKLSLN